EHDLAGTAKISRSVATALKASAALCVVGLLAGCQSKAFVDQREMVPGGTRNEPLVVPILNKIDPSSENNAADYANATPPLPSDMVTNTNDYTVGRNDLLNISISDLTAPGVQSTEVKRVSESGRISLPFLGPIQAAGMTEIELEQAINKAYRDANII